MMAILEKISTLLQNKKWMLSTAESCTGGLLAKLCTDRAGSSNWFDRAFVTYSNGAKSDMLNVDAQLIVDKGAVSEEVVNAMVAGARKNSAAQVSIAITGIAGPSGGSQDKPIGTVWIAWSVGQYTESQCYMFAGNREKIRALSAQKAFEKLLEILKYKTV